MIRLLLMVFCFFFFYSVDAFIVFGKGRSLLHEIVFGINILLIFISLKQDFLP